MGFHSPSSHKLITLLVFFWGLGLFKQDVQAVPAKPSTELQKRIREAAARVALDPRLLEAVIEVESNFNPRATSKKGAMGLMQVMPQNLHACGIEVPYHQVDNLTGASECLRRLINRYQGDLNLALAAYNAGPANVARYGGVPPFPETQKYVRRILKIYRQGR
jgi:soluble lytic murein transglycosylase-like protein